MALPRLKPALNVLDVRSVKREVPATDSWRAGKTSAQRGYGYKWQKARERYLSANPLCRYCMREGRVTPAIVVDHIDPHRGDKAKFWNEANWQPLCKACHDSIKAKEEARMK